MAALHPAPTVAEIVALATRSEPLVDAVSPGYSGARLERLTLEDGRAYILKRATSASDLAMAATSDPGRAYLFLAEGIYDRLPASVDATVLAVDRVGDEWRMLMEDVSGHLLPDDTSISRADSGRILAAMRDLHAAFAGEVSPLLCPLEAHVGLFSPASMSRFTDWDNPLPRHALDAWQRFDSAASNRLRESVHAIRDRPQPLARELVSGGTTLAHADLALANIGLTPDQVIMLDFALACRAPGDVDFAIYLIQNDWLINATNDQVVADWRDCAPGPVDHGTLRLALLAAFVEYGCWKAPDPGEPAPYCDSFDWWVDAAEAALATDGARIGL